MEYGSSGITRTGSLTIPQYGYSSGSSSSAVSQLDLPNQLPPGFRRRGKDLNQRYVKGSRHSRPYIPRPFSEQLADPSSPLAKLETLSRSSLLEHVNPEESSKRNPAQMLERLERLQKAMGRPFTRPKLLAPDASKGADQTDLKMDDMGQPLLTFNMAMSMLRQLQDMKEIAKQQVDDGGRTQEAWTLGLLTQLKLEQLHTELINVTQYYCELYPESYTPSDSFSDLRGLDLTQTSRPPVPIAPPFRPLNPEPPSSVISREAFEEAKKQYDIKALQNENEALTGQVKDLQDQLRFAEQRPPIHKFDSMSDTASSIGSSSVQSFPSDSGFQQEMQEQIAHLEQLLSETREELKLKQADSVRVDSHPPTTVDDEVNPATIELAQKFNEQAKQLEDYAQQISSLSDSLSTGQLQIQSMDLQLKTTLEEVDRLRLEKEQLSTELGELKDSDVQRQLHQQKIEYLEQQLSDKTQEFVQRNNQAEKEQSKLLEQLELERFKQEEMTTQLNETLVAAKVLENDNKHLTETLRFTQEALSKTEESSGHRLDALKTERDELLQYKRQWADSYDELNREVQKLLNELEVIKSETDTRVETLQHQVETLTAENEDLHTYKQETDIKVAQLAQSVDFSEQKVTRLERELVTAQSKLETKKKKYRDQKELQTSLLIDLEKSQQLVRQLETTVDELQKDLSQSRSEAFEKMELESELHYSKETLRLTQDQVQKQLGEVSILRELLTKEQEQVTTLTETVSQLVKEREKALTAFEESIALAQLEVKSSQDTISKLENEREALLEAAEAAKSGKIKAESLLELEVENRRIAEEKAQQYATVIADSKVSEEERKQAESNLKSTQDSLKEVLEREQSLLEEQVKYTETQKQNDLLLEKAKEELAVATTALIQQESLAKQAEEVKTELEEKVLTDQRTISQLNEAVQKSKEEVQTLQNSYETRLQEARDREQQVQNTLSQKEARVAKLEEELKQTQKRLEQEIKARKDEQEGFETQRSALAKEVSLAKRAAEEQKERVSELSNKLQLSIKAKQELDTQLLQLQQQLEGQQNLAEKANSEKRQAEARVSALEGTIETLNTEISGWREKLQSAKREQQNSALKHHEETEKVRQQLAIKVLDAELKVTELDRQKQAVDKALADVKKELEDVQDREGQLKTEVSKQKKQIKQLQELKTELEDELKVLRKTSGEQSQSTKDFKQQLSDQQQTLDSQKLELEKLKASTIQLTDTNRRLNSNLQDSHNREEGLQTEITDLKNQLIKQKNESDVSLRDLNIQLSLKQTELEEVQSHTDQLNKQLVTVSGKLSQAQTDLQLASDKSLKLEAELTGLRQTYDDQVGRLNQQLSSLNQKIKWLEDQSGKDSTVWVEEKSKLTKASDELRRQLFEKEQALLRAESDVNRQKLESDRALQNLSDQLTDSRNQVKTLGDERSDFKEQFETARTTVSEHEKTIFDLTSRLQTSTSLINTYEEQVQELTQLLERKAELLKTLKQEKQAAKDHVEELTVQLDQANKVSLGLQKDRDRLNEQLEEAQQDVENLTEKERLLQKTVAGLGADLSQLKETNQTLGTTIERLQAQLTTGAEKLLVVETDLQNKTEEAKDLKREVTRLAANCKRVESENQQLNESLIKLQTREQELKNEIAALKQTLESLRDDSGKRIKELQQESESKVRELRVVQQQTEEVRGQLNDKSEELKTVKRSMETGQHNLSELSKQLTSMQEQHDIQVKDLEHRGRELESTLEQHQFKKDLETSSKKAFLSASPLEAELETEKLEEKLERTGFKPPLHTVATPPVDEIEAGSSSNSSRRSSVSMADSEAVSSSDDSGIVVTSGRKSPVARKKVIYSGWVDVAPLVLNVSQKPRSSKITEQIKVSSILTTVENEWDRTSADKQALDEEYGDISLEGLALENLPSKASYNAALAKIYGQLDDRLQTAKASYQEILGEGESDQAYEQLEDVQASVEHNLELLRVEKESFEAEVAKLQSTLQQLQPKDSLKISDETSEEIVDTGLNNMLLVLSEPAYAENGDLSTHSLCVIAKWISDSLVEAWDQTVQEKVTPDSRHNAMQAFKASLKRLHPDNLPPSVKRQTSALANKYLLEVINVTEEEMQSSLEQHHGLKGTEDTTLEAEILQNPNAVSRVLTLIGSLKDSHEGMAKNRDQEEAWVDYDYAKASLVGLKRIRDEFKLPAPVMKELLKAMLNNLKKDDSLVLAEALKQHRGQYEATGQGSRKGKIETRCRALLKKENDLPEELQLRGVSFQGQTRVEHPHQDVLKAFSKNGDLVSLEDQQHKTAGLITRNLKAGSSSLLNVLLSGLGGSAVMKTSPLTGDAVIELENVSCHPALVFGSRNQKDWQVVLNGASWTVDPTFLLDNPNFRVPFEVQSVGNNLKRAWIPLRNASGETTLLVIQKTPPIRQCYLYEMGDKDTLVPIPIQGGEPLAEIKRATFLAQACQLTPESPTVMRGTVLSDEVKAVEVLTKNSGLPKVSLLQLQHCFQNACQQVEDARRMEPFECVPADEQIRRSTVRLPVAAKIMRIKSSQERTGAKLNTFDTPKFEQFSVDASFDLVTQAFKETMSSQLEGDDGFLEALVAERKKFSQEAFKAMTVFAGCELVSGSQLKKQPLQTLKKNRKDVAVQFDKVLKSNQSHCMRVAQHKEGLESALVQVIRKQSDKRSNSLSNRELLDFTIKNFERGRVAEWMKQPGFIERLVELMLTEIDLEQRTRLGAQLDSLRRKLEKLDYDAFEVAKHPDEYRKQCQEWNLQMALLASRQLNITTRIQSYEDQQLNSETLALLCFERRHKIVLSDDQANELKQVLGGIHRWAEGDEVSMISHKGTGYGKSTILLALTDSASSLLDDRIDRSVVVMAPESNQAELDIMLGRYYARKGLNYQRLDLAKMFAPPNGKISVARLLKVHNVLLGLPENCTVKEFDKRIKQPRAPVGVSITDVQVLMQLRHAIQRGDINRQESASLLAQLDSSLDLLRNSMLFADEFDSAMMPHSEQELVAVAEKVSQTIKHMTGVTVDVRPADIVMRHSEFVFGSKAKSLLSATVATPYALSLVSGSSSPAKAKELARTDPFTTTPRFWHFLSQSEPVFYSSQQGEPKTGIIKHVLGRVGCEPQIVYFDGLESGERCQQKAIEMSREINRQRRALGASGKGVIYYDDQKHLQLQRDQDQKYGKGAPISEDMETLFRRSGCQEADGYLSQSQSVGTDIPQGIDSVGVFDGALHLPEGGYRAREDLLAQRLGRLMRASKDLHKTQRLFVAVDLNDIKKLKQEGADTKAFDDAHAENQQCEQILTQTLGTGMDGLTEPLKTVVLKPLKIEPDDWQDSDESTVIEAKVEQEVERLAEGEWQLLQLTGEQLSALKTYKKAQWLLKKNWLELMAVQVAKQEVNGHTVKCEKSLAKARVNSCLDRVYADEYNWLQNEGVRIVQSCDITGDELPQRTREQVIPAIRSTVEDRISAIGRRTHDGGVTPDSLLGAVSFNATQQDLEKVFTDIKGSGVGLEEQDVVTQARKELVEQSRLGLLEAREKVSAVYELLLQAGKDVSGKNAFKLIRDRLDGDIASLETDEAENTAFATENKIKQAYSDMMDAVMNVVLSERGFKQIDEQIVAKLKACVNWSNEYRLTSNKSSYGRNKVESSPDMTVPAACRAGDNLYKFRWYTLSPSSGNQIKTKKLLGTIADKRCDKAQGNFSHKKVTMANQKEFKTKADALRQRLQEQSELQEAQTVCSTPSDPRFQRCVKDLEQALLSAFDALAKQQEEAAKQEQQLMLEQKKLMQTQLFQTVTVH